MGTSIAGESKADAVALLQSRQSMSLWNAAHGTYREGSIGLAPHKLAKRLAESSAEIISNFILKTFREILGL
jgi:hypothetical protein